MEPLQHPDNLHLRAALGWLELGNHLEANEELEHITPEIRTHPDVLEVCWQINSAAKKWETCIAIAVAIVKLTPDQSAGWIHRSFSLHELKRTEEAYELLLPAREKFPDQWVIPYNLACYSAQLGKIEECAQWFEKAMTMDDKSVKETAMDDPDLVPLWKSRWGSRWKREK